MLNPFVMKKNAAIALASVLTPLFFTIGLVYYNLYIGIGLMLFAMLLNFIIVSKLIDNPFRKMIEGKGLLAIRWDSTGVMQPFIVGLNNPFIHGFLDKFTQVHDVFDRDLTGYLAEPISIKANNWNETNEGLSFSITKEEYNKARFAMFHYPVLLWNDQLKTFITKDQLSEKEKDTFADHGILYAVHLIREIGADIKNFSRAVVDSTQKKGFGINKNMIIIFILIIIIGAVIVMVGPSFLSMFSGVSESVSNIMPTETVTIK